MRLGVLAANCFAHYWRSESPKMVYYCGCNKSSLAIHLNLWQVSSHSAHYEKEKNNLSYTDEASQRPFCWAYVALDQNQIKIPKLKPLFIKDKQTDLFDTCAVWKDWKNVTAKTIVCRSDPTGYWKSNLKIWTTETLSNNMVHYYKILIFKNTCLYNIPVSSGTSCERLVVQANPPQNIFTAVWM